MLKRLLVLLTLLISSNLSATDLEKVSKHKWVGPIRVEADRCARLAKVIPSAGSCTFAIDPSLGAGENFTAMSTAALSEGDIIIGKRAGAVDLYVLSDQQADMTIEYLTNGIVSTLRVTDGYKSCDIASP